MKLVIAEKPSVALSLAKVLGATKKHDGYLAGGGYLVSWCYGHLLKLADPEQYDESLKKWTYETLPVINTACRRIRKSSLPLSVR